MTRGHRELFAFLMLHTPPRHQFLVACMLADRPLAEGIAGRFPGLVGELDAGTPLAPGQYPTAHEGFDAVIASCRRGRP